MSTLVSLIALGAVALFFVYAAVLIVAQVTRMVRADRLHDVERDLLTAKIARLTDRLANLDVAKGGAAWSGHRKFVLAGKVLEAENVCSLYLAPHDGQPLPPFLPGQYLTFTLDAGGTGKRVTRCYSLSDSPTHPDYYRITVKRIAAAAETDGTRDGVVSSVLHREIAPDDLLDVKAPTGHFHLDPEQQGPVVLVAGGIGITPLLSMLNFICATGSMRETWLFYGVGHGGEHIMKSYLRQLATEHENVHLHVCYSEARPDLDVKGVDYDHAERVSTDLFQRLLPSNNYEFFVCGPAPMMDELTHGLEAWGVPGERIHCEAFGAATVRSIGKDVTRTLGDPFEVEFARSGNTLLWDGSSASILEFAEAAGIPMESGCRAGNCGSCLTAIRSGRITYFGDPGAAVEEGSCLTCISVPQGNLVLDA